MDCANPGCHRDAEDLRNGSLRLLELDVPPEDTHITRHFTSDT